MLALVICNHDLLKCDNVGNHVSTKYVQQKYILLAPSITVYVICEPFCK